MRAQLGLPLQVLLWALLAVGTSLTLQTPGAWREPNFTTLALLLAIISLDRGAVALQWGLWRGSAALILGAAVVGTQGGAAVTALAWVGSALLRGPFWHKLGWAASLQVLIALGTRLPWGWNGVAVGLLFLAGERWRSSSKEAPLRRLRYSVLPFDVGLAALIPVLGMAHLDLAMVLAAPLLWACQQGVGTAHIRVFAEKNTQAEERLRSSEQVLDRTRGELDRKRQDLEKLARRQNLLEGFSRHLAQDLAVQPTMEAVVETVRTVIPCRSAVLFLYNGKLYPGAFRSPEVKALEGCLLTGLVHPLVEQALRTGMPECWQGHNPIQNQSSPLLPCETYALACPLGEMGVLYAGREDAAISAEEAQLLSWIAHKATLALTVAMQQESKRKVMEEQSIQNYALLERLHLLENLVEGSRWLGTHLSPDSLLQALQRQLAITLPHDAGGLVSPELQLLRRWGGTGTGFPEAWRAVAEAVQQNQAPLLFPEMLQSRFAPLGQEGRCLMAAPLLLQNQVLGVLILVTDIPQSFDREHLHVLTLVALQLAVSFSNARLHQEVVEARHKLEVSQGQLVQSSKMNAIGQLAAGVAHELNTPLGAISLSLEMLEMQGASGKNLQNAQTAVEQAQKIVHKLLVYSRKETETRSDWVSLPEVIVGACELVTSRFRMRRTQLQWEDGKGWEVMARGVELQQVLVNLLINAGDASPEGGKVMVSVHSPEEGGCIIEVRDWAGGIPREIQDRIFEPFFTTKPVGQGTGLGLSICREIIDQFKATLDFQSVEGQGTAFRIHFPAALSRS